MHLIALYIAAAALAQSPLHGDIPRDVPTFEMRHPDGSIEYGALYLDNDWYRAETVTLAPAQRPTIVSDTPWSPTSNRVMRLPEFSIETPVLRETRLKREWDAAGYAPVATPHGELYFPKEEIALAQRAAEMEAALLNKAATLPAAAPEPAATTPAPPDFLTQWGPRLAAALLGLALTATVFWRMVLRNR